MYYGFPVSKETYSLTYYQKALLCNENSFEVNYWRALMESVDKYRNLLKQGGVVLGSFSQNNNTFFPKIGKRSTRSIKNRKLY